MPIIAPALKIEQHGVPIYITALPVGTLIEKTDVDRYSPESGRGYQRAPVLAHIRKIARYVQGRDALMPVAGLLNIRRRGKIFHEHQQMGGVKIGTLRIEDGTTLWVVDMQHRREGFKKACETLPELEGFYLPVVITHGLDMAKEALQFYIINTKSKRIGVDLARRLLIEHLKTRTLRNVAEVKAWEIKATKIVIELNKNPRIRNPWTGLIKAPNAPPGTPYVQSEKTLVSSLRYLTENPNYRNLNDKKLAKYVANYWRALEDIFPDAFAGQIIHAAPPEDRYGRRYLIQGTTALVAFHIIMPTIFDRVSRNGKDTNRLTRENLYRALRPLERLGSNFWMRGRQISTYGTGYGAQIRLADFLSKRLGLLRRP